MKYTVNMEKHKREQIVDIIVSDENTGIVEIVKGGFDDVEETNAADKAKRNYQKNLLQAEITIIDKVNTDKDYKVKNVPGSEDCVSGPGFDGVKPDNTRRHIADSEATSRINENQVDNNLKDDGIGVLANIDIRRESIDKNFMEVFDFGKRKVDSGEGMESDENIITRYNTFADNAHDPGSWKEKTDNHAVEKFTSKNVFGKKKDVSNNVIIRGNADAVNEVSDNAEELSVNRCKEEDNREDLSDNIEMNFTVELKCDDCFKGIGGANSAMRKYAHEKIENNGINNSTEDNDVELRQKNKNVRHRLSRSKNVEELEDEKTPEEGESVKFATCDMDVNELDRMDLNVVKMFKVSTSIDDSNLSEIDEVNTDESNGNEIDDEEIGDWSEGDDATLENDLDEEVEVIMKSSEMLDKISNEIRKSVREKQIEEAQQYRKRSKSIDNANIGIQNFNFAKYGISIGVGSANDLLPGIEEFLSTVLGNESLSPYAEEQRQYFLERLDIIKLPPSVPPRPQSLGVHLSPVNYSPASVPDRNSIPSIEQEDFAAYQRELSRALVDSETSPDPPEVKVYDDIDPSDVSSVTEEVKSSKDEEESMYEIPQIQRHLSDSGYEKAVDISSISKSSSSEEVLLTPGTSIAGAPMPPPLPPRRERSASDAASRSSIGSALEERTQDLSQRNPPLSRDLSVTSQQDKTGDSRSERSSDDILDENTDDQFDGISYDSLDETGSVTQEPDPEILPTVGVKLPQPTKKKRRRNSQRRKVGPSLSSLKESTQPFRVLEDVTLSGELHYRSKLSWNKKMAALTNGRLVCYKADKLDVRPSFVILLTGYHATFQKREGRRSFEISLTHDHIESHLFLADFKEWAETWCEHINYAAEGKKAPGPVLHLARGTMIENSDGTYNVAKSSLQSSNSNLSMASSDDFDSEPGTIKVKKRDQSGTKTAKMGTFAFRATQFFESLGKKSSIKKRSSSCDRSRHLSSSQSSLCEQISPLTPESGIVESPLESAIVESPLHFATVESPLEVTRHIKHQGYLDIYSSFNKRKWGKRWCMIHENNFECYRTQTSEICELEFLLRNCILRRAIEETKSELGLMLTENNREKITIEPMNWTELGSWLRVLMRETSTTVTPEGLEAYMDDTNPYHEAVEITRLSDPFPQSPPGVSPVANDRTLTNADSEDERKRQGTPTRKNRDSGNCSSESMFGSLERKQTGIKTHSCYTDSSLPRVSVNNSGDIYTQVRKSASKIVPSNGQNSSSQRQTNQSEGKNSADTRKPVSEKTEDRLVFDFENSDGKLSSYNHGESLVDEIMSQFTTQISGGFELENSCDTELTNQNQETEGEDLCVVNIHNSSGNGDPAQTHRASTELSEIEKIISPIKDKRSDDTPERVVTMATENFACSSFVEEDHVSFQSQNRLKENGASNKDDVIENIKQSASENINICDKKQEHRQQDANVDLRVKPKEQLENAMRKGSSLVYNAAQLEETLDELRTRLVQLKKDRISIRDRKQKISSQINKDYLEAEFNRLNRECAKVDEEIAYFEKLRLAATSCSNISEPVNTNGSKDNEVTSSTEDISDRQTKTEEIEPELVKGEISENKNKEIEQELVKGEISENNLMDDKSKLCDNDQDTGQTIKAVSINTNTDSVQKTEDGQYKMSAIQTSDDADILDSNTDKIDRSTKCADTTEALDKLTRSHSGDTISEDIDKVVSKKEERLKETLLTEGTDVDNSQLTIDQLTEDFENLLKFETDS